MESPRPRQPASDKEAGRGRSTACSALRSEPVGRRRPEAAREPRDRAEDGPRRPKAQQRMERPP
eukprot:9109070-Pyramimonas_sp.AAC.1